MVSGWRVHDTDASGRLQSQCYTPFQILFLQEDEAVMAARHQSRDKEDSQRTMPFAWGLLQPSLTELTYCCVEGDGHIQLLRLKKKSSLPHWVRVPPRKLTEGRENKRHSLTHSRTLRYIGLGNVRRESVQTGLLYLHFLSFLSFWQQKFCSQMHFCLLPKVA